MQQADLDLWHLRRALELAAQGQGWVEPNPMVGCVVARGAEIIGEGWHRRYGGAHAEVEALAVAGERARGAALYVTLEPCSHFGKTPPCTEAILAAGVARVVVAAGDPAAHASGRGLAQLAAAGVEVSLGLAEAEARRLMGPYLRLLEQGRPWVLAKWAMTLDGKLATRSGDSRWISSDESRQRVHRLRGRMDAIVVGIGTALADDPLLTARPAGPRVPLRIVLDSRARLPLASQLVRTAAQAGVMVVVGPAAAAERCRALEQAGCEVWRCDAPSPPERWEQLLHELGRRRLTNLLCEGGGQVLGSLFDAQLVDEVHVFVAPRLIGGARATPALAGEGQEWMAQAWRLDDAAWETVGGDLYVRGRVAGASDAAPTIDSCGADRPFVR